MPSSVTSPEELYTLAAGLKKVARNLWWTWNQEAQEIFHELSPRAWQTLYHNAVAVLQEVSAYELHVRLYNPHFARRVRRVIQAFDSYMKETDTWGARHAPTLALSLIHI